MLETPTVEHLNLCVETLQNAKKAAPTLDRDVKVLQPSVGSKRYELSSDFYRITKEDLMAEQKRRYISHFGRSLYITRTDTSILLK